MAKKQISMLEFKNVTVVRGRKKILDSLLLTIRVAKTSRYSAPTAQANRLSLKQSPESITLCLAKRISRSGFGGGTDGMFLICGFC